MRGFSHTPRNHSFPQTGEYPALPVFADSNRAGYTSARPRNSERKSAIFSAGLEVWVIGMMRWAADMDRTRPNGHIQSNLHEPIISNTMPGKDLHDPVDNVVSSVIERFPP